MAQNHACMAMTVRKRKKITLLLGVAAMVTAIGLLLKFTQK